MTTDRYLNEDGWTVDCTHVLAGHGPEVWSLVVLMDDESVNKQSQIMRAGDFDSEDSEMVFETRTWISSCWVSPDGILHACDGKTHLYGRPGSKLQVEKDLSDHMVFHPWGLAEDDMFLLGDAGLVLRGRTGDWRDISLPDGRRLLGIHGCSPDAIYAVGAEGAFCRLVGDVWEVIDLGIDADLRAVLVEADGTVWACGAAGIAFRYADGETQFLGAEPGRYFGGVCRYKGRVYFGASGEGVDVLDGNNIVPFKSTIHGQRLSCNDDFLWSCGGNSIYRFDGNGWLAESFG